jgi:hypothetical protein
MKILAIEKTGLNRMELWVEDGRQYKNVAIFDDDRIDELTTLPVNKYEDYDHFVAVMGKFNPHTIFRVNPVSMKVLDFEKLVDLTNKFEKEARAYAKELIAEGGEENVG